MPHKLLASVFLASSIWYLASISPVTAGTMTHYGVIFSPTSDYSSLMSKGQVDVIETTISGNWQTALDLAAANGQKLVIIAGWQDSQICQGSAGWTWNGTDWTLNSTGTAFMDFIVNYIKSGGQGFLALYTVHEPYNTQHSPNCGTEPLKKLYSMLKTQASQRGLTGDQLPLYAEIDTMTRSDFGPGICDYCADWYYVNGECGGSTFDQRLNACITKMRSNYQGLAAKSPNSTFVAYAQSFGGNTGYTMPTASELEAEGNAYISELKNNFSGNFMFAWYTWSGQYPIYLKSSPGGDASYQIMANVFNNYAANITPTPTPIPPTPTTPINRPGDANGDNVVNGVDYVIWLNHYKQTGSGGPGIGDFNTSGLVDGVDYVIWLNNYTINSPPARQLSLYGVKFGGTQDYAQLAGLGVMHPVTSVNGNASIDTVITAARNIRATYPDFKPILWLWPEGWTCDAGINNTGRSFIAYLDSKNYWNDILAIYGLHEPMGTYWGGVYCTTLAKIIEVHNSIRALSVNHIKLFLKMYSDVSFKNTGFADGICDYCGVMYHPYRQYDSTTKRTTAENCPASGPCFRKNEMLANLERDLNTIQGTPAGVTLNLFTPYLGIIHWPESNVYGTGQYMPGPAEMSDGGQTIINYKSSLGYQVDGLIWYTWGNNSTWTGLDEYNGDGQRGSRMEVVRQLSPYAP